MANIKGNHQAILNTLERQNPGARRAIKDKLRNMTQKDGMLFLNTLLDISRKVRK